MENLKLFIIVQVAVLALGSLILHQGRDAQSAASFAMGCGLVLFNVLTLAWAWSRLFKKKLIALAAGIIVFKYAILGIIMYKLLSLDWVDKLWLSIGLSSLVVSALFYASFAPTADEEEENQ